MPLEAKAPILRSLISRPPSSTVLGGGGVVRLDVHAHGAVGRDGEISEPRQGSLVPRRAPLVDELVAEGVGVGDVDELWDADAEAASKGGAEVEGGEGGGSLGGYAFEPVTGAGGELVGEVGGVAEVGVGGVAVGEEVDVVVGALEDGLGAADEGGGEVEEGGEALVVEGGEGR